MPILPKAVFSLAIVAAMAAGCVGDSPQARTPLPQQRTALPEAPTILPQEGTAMSQDHTATPQQGTALPQESTAQPHATRSRIWIGLNNFALASASDVHVDCSGPANEQLLDAKFTAWTQHKIEVVRFWAFQSYATNDATGQRDWRAFDRVFDAARRHNIQLVPVIGNHGTDCDWSGRYPGDYERGNAGTCSGHWYDTGYKQPYDGYAVSYRDWVTEIVSRYSQHPALKVWEVVNEPNDVCIDVIHRFFVDATGLVRAADPTTPISLGASGRGESWTDDDGYAREHAIETVNWATAHDYGAASDPFPVSPSCERNCMRSDLAAARSLGKPFYIGEAGIDTCDTPERAEQFRRKILAMEQAGVAGFLLWDYKQNDGPICDHTFGPNSPILDMVLELQSRP